MGSIIDDNVSTGALPPGPAGVRDGVRGVGGEVSAPSGRPRLLQQPLLRPVVRGRQVSDSGRGNLPGGHCVHHRHLPAVRHDRGGRRHWLLQPETLPVRELDQRHGHSVSAGQPGTFLSDSQLGGFQGPAVDYNVVWLDEDTAIEYDCTEHILGNIDYCVHFMSRTPTIDPVKLEELKVFISGLGLNTHDLEYKEGDQNGCW